MPSRPSLRDTVAAGLANLPNATRLGITVASSAKKRTTILFPYASPSASVRCWETEHLIVVDCGLPPDADGEGESSSAAVNTNTNGSASTSTTPQSALAAAISVNVYTLPNKDVPTSLVYISKVDSSGYASSAGPLTRELAISVLYHFLGPATRPTPRVHATLFARSQGQYLFPNSIEGGGKRVLGGLGLCQWWKGVYEGAAARLVENGVPRTELALRYLLPSYSAAEAKGMLRAPASPPPVDWAYAPPFVGSLLSTSTSSTSTSTSTSLALLVPSLPDDPKTRFLDEIASEILEATPYAHTAAAATASAAAANATSTSTTSDNAGAPAAPPSPKKRKRDLREAFADEEDRKRTHAGMSKISPEEFWERIGFRQECSSGDVTGFFSMTVDAPTAATERAPAATASATEGTAGDTDSAVTLTLPLVERLLKSMLNTDFGTRALSAAGTQTWLEAAKRLIVDEVGERGYAACVGSVEAKVGERTERKRKEEVVTVLQPRKRKK